jgi:threonine/homoserine/homoserine lactone efflux protein
VSWSGLLGFSGTAMVLLALPGPSVLFVVTRGVVLGRKAALATVVGNELGLAVHLLAVALGVGTIVQRSLGVFTAMKLGGAAYLVWLGVGAIRCRGGLGDALVPSSGRLPRRRLVRDGFVVGVSNPKTTLFFLAVLPQFVEPARGHVTLQLAILGAVFLVLAFVNDALYGLAAGTVRNWLDRSPRLAELVGGTSGLVMIGLGLRLAVTSRKD